MDTQAAIGGRAGIESEQMWKEPDLKKGLGRQQVCGHTWNVKAWSVLCTRSCRDGNRDPAQQVLNEQTNE